MSFLTIAGTDADRLASLVEVGLAVKAQAEDFLGSLPPDPNEKPAEGEASAEGAAAAPVE